MMENGEHARTTQPVHRTGRPRGEIAQAVLHRLKSEGPTTARELADALLITPALAWSTCSRLMQRGEIEVVERQRIPGVNKPVSVYGIACPLRSARTPMRLPAAFFARA